jgi:hypothetical protein
MKVDPLAEVVTLLQPTARFSKLIECGGSWKFRNYGDSALNRGWAQAELNALSP